MAAASGLPDDILHRIIQRLAPAQGSGLRGFTKLLPFMAVCRSWRSAAVHAVYRNVYIGYGPTLCSPNDEWESELDQELEDKMDRRNRKTNAALVRDNGLHRLVKTVYLVQTPTTSLRHTLEIIRDAFSEYVDVWPSANRLVVMMAVENFNGDIDPWPYGIETREPLGLAQQIVLKLPNITNLTVRSAFSKGVLDVLFYNLAREYAPRLQQLGWNTCTELGPNVVMDHLTSCDLYLTNHGENLPLINPVSLRSMYLISFKVGFSWDCFRRDESSSAIVFENLDTLRLGGSDGILQSEATAPPQSKDVAPLTPTFPQLRRLEFWGTPMLGPKTLEPFVVPSLENIRYSGPLGKARYLYALDLGRRRQIQFNIYTNSNNVDIAFYNRMNELLQHADGAQRVLVQFKRALFGLDPQQIDWPGVHHLKIRCIPSENIELDLIPRLPKLVSLDITASGRRWIAISKAKAREYFEDLKNKWPEPTEHQLQSLVIRVPGSHILAFHESAEDFYRHRFPKLACFGIRDY